MQCRAPTDSEWCMDDEFDRPCPQSFNLADYVLSANGTADNKTALEVLGQDDPETRSYGALRSAVAGVAAGLLAAGLTSGNRVLLRLGNTIEFPICYLGAIWAGMVPAVTSASLTRIEISELSRVIKPDLIIAADGIALPDTDVRVLGSHDLQRFYDLPPVPPELGDPNRPGYVVCTSGTMAGPKAVLHAHRAIWARRMMIRDWYALRPSDRMMHAGAFNWTYTLGTGLMDPWTVGATALIPRHGTSPEDLPALIRSAQATIFAAAPGVYRQMLREFDAKPHAFSKLRHGLTAGEKCPEETRAQWEHHTGTALHEAFGMSECSTFISGSPHRPAPPGSLGYPQRGRHVSLVRADGSDVGDGEPGICAISGDDPGLMLGYLGQPPFEEDWYLTGDEMIRHADGSLSYLGRDDDMMNAGGFRVSPLEVEAALLAHPDVAEAAAVEHEVRPNVCVIAAHYVAVGPLDEAELSAHMEERIARYKQPRLYFYATSLPRSANGKLVRRALRQVSQ